MEKEHYFNWLNELEITDSRIEHLRAYAQENNVPIIQDEGMAFLKHLIRLTRPMKILEIGAAIGYSSIMLALSDEQLSITTLERDEKMIEIAKKNIETFNLKGRIHLIEADAITFNDEELSKDYDLIFIDAAKSQYQHFFNKYEPHLKQGGVIVTDNLIFHGLIFQERIQNRHTRSLMKKLREFNHWLKDNSDYDTYFLPIGDGMALSIKK